MILITAGRKNHIDSKIKGLGPYAKEQKGPRKKHQEP